MFELHLMEVMNICILIDRLDTTKMEKVVNASEEKLDLARKMLGEGHVNSVLELLQAIMVVKEKWDNIELNTNG